MSVTHSVYMINVTDRPGYVYIGKAQNVDARWQAHLNQLRRGTHHNAPLQRLWTLLDDADCFWVQVLEEHIHADHIDERERFWIQDAIRGLGTTRVLNTQRVAPAPERPERTPAAAPQSNDLTAGRAAAEELLRSASDEQRRKTGSALKAFTTGLSFTEAVATGWGVKGGGMWKQRCALLRAALTVARHQQLTEE